MQFPQLSPLYIFHILNVVSRECARTEIILSEL